MQIVLTTVLPFSFQPGTYFKLKLWCYRHVAEIKKFVQIRTQQYSIAYAMGSK